MFFFGGTDIQNKPWDRAVLKIALHYGEGAIRRAAGITVSVSEGITLGTMCIYTPH